MTLPTVRFGYSDAMLQPSKNAVLTSVIVIRYHAWEEHIEEVGRRRWPRRSPRLRREKHADEDDEADAQAQPAEEDEGVGGERA